jgi:hypothetical protein
MAPVLGRWLAKWMTSGNPSADLGAFAPDRFATGSLQPERNVI